MSSLEREKEARESKKAISYPFIPVPVPIFLPLSTRFFDEFLERVWPKEYYDSYMHLQNARIEMLKAVESAIGKRIETLERAQKEARPQKEKVKVE
ncbi:MAG: hypothetical protein QXG05_02480 [Nitrososphaerota archaeon]